MKTFVVLFSILVLAGLALAQDGDAPEMPAWIVTLLGVLAPPVVQVVVKKITNEWGRFAASMLLSGVIGVVVMFALGYNPFVGPEMVAMWFTFSSMAYKLAWKPIWQKNGSRLRAAATTYGG